MMTKNFLPLILLVFLAAGIFASPPTIGGIPNIEIEENSGSSYHLIDLRDYSDDDEDNDYLLDFTIVDQSDDDLIYCYIDDDHYIGCSSPLADETGSSRITVEVEDTDADTDEDVFIVYVVPYEPSYSDCDDLDIRTHTVYIDEDGTEYELFKLRNNAERRFYIDDVEAYDYSSYFSISEYDNEDYANAGGEADIEIKIRAYSVSRDRTGTGYIRVRGHFSKGRDCSFSAIGTESFTVRVDDEAERTGCGEIDLRLQDVTVPENSTKYKTFSIRNDANERFYIEGVDVSDSSTYFTADDYSHDRSIGADSVGNLKIKIKSNSVPSDRTGRVTVKVKGHFSGGRSCSYTDIKDSFDVTVEDGDEEEPEGEIEINLSTAAIMLKPAQSKTIAAEFNNATAEWTCLTLSTKTTSSKISASLEDDYFCLNPDQERVVDLTVLTSSTATEGSYSVELRTKYGSATNVKTAKVTVEAPTAQPELIISYYPQTIEIKANESEEVVITIENTGNVVVEDITVNLSGLPQGVYFEPIHKAGLNPGRSVTLTGILEVGEVEERVFTALLEVEAEGIRKVKGIDINVTKEAEGEGVGAGLVSLAGSATLGLALLVVLLVIIIIVVSVAKRK